MTVFQGTLEEVGGGQTFRQRRNSISNGTELDICGLSGPHLRARPG